MGPKSQMPAETTTVEAACPFCGGAGRVLFEGRDRLHAIGGVFGVSACTDCGFVFTSPRPPVERLGDYYPEDYSPHAPRPPVKAGLKARLRSAVLQEYFAYPGGGRPVRRAILLPAYAAFRADSKNVFYVPWHGEGRMLEVGCGSGRWLSRLKGAGWRTAGLDISPQAAKVAADAYDVEVEVGTYPRKHFPAASFDVVTFWNSLEHMTDPVGVLESAHAVLAAGGLLYASVPNFASFGARRFRENWFPLDLPRHLNHFTPDTLSAALEKAGFEPLWIRPLRRTSSLLKSARFAVESGDTRIPSRIMATRPGAGLISRIAAVADACDLVTACALKRRHPRKGGITTPHCE